MPSRRRSTAWLLAGALAGALAPRAAAPFSNVEIGAPLENPALPSLDGPKVELLSRKARASLFVFFRPHQDHSADALEELVELQQELAGKPVRFVGVVSDAWTADEVKALLREKGVTFPVLVDVGDALYGKLGVRLHPVVGIADASLRLAAYEHYRRINFKEIVLARLRRLLGEITDADVARVLEPEKATTGSPEALARRFYNLGRMLAKRGNHEKALEAARQSLAVQKTAAAFALEGEALAGLGRCAEALTSFEAALKIDPVEPVALQGRKACGR